MSKVSAIIPAHNAARHVEQAVDSVLAQTHPDVELIVVDDGSTDRTAELLDDYGDRLIVHRQPNAGVAAARNAGARLATGEWLAFLDADDVWAPEKLEKQLALDHAPLVYSDRFNVGVLGVYPRRQSDGRQMLEGDIFEPLLLQGNFITASSVMMRRAFFEELGGFSTQLRVCEDWDLWLRAAAQHPVTLLKEPVVEYRVGPIGLSGNYREMSETRQLVVDRALALPRGQQMSWRQRRQVWAETYRTNGWDASRRGAKVQALAHYARAAAAWPLELQSFTGAMRALIYA